MRHFLFVGSLAALLLPLPAFAQGAFAPVEEEQPAQPPLPAPDPRDSAWDAGYKEARNELVTGEFAAAAGHFTELARSAKNASDRALAMEQASLAAEWSRRGLAFVRRDDLGESTLSAKAVDVRTSDEISSLYATAILYGLGAGGWVDVIAQPKSTAGAVFPPLLGAGAAAGVVAILDSGRGLRYGVAQSIVSGMYIGLEEGIVLTAYNQSRPNRYQMSAEAVSTLIFTTATTGAFVGGFVGDRVGTTPGRASWVGSAALWSGLVTGLLGDAASTSRTGSTGTLVGTFGLNAGVVGGLLSAGSVSPSIARVRFIDLGGVVGFLLFGGIYLAASDRKGNAQVGSGVAALGITAGLASAWWATSGMAPDRITHPEPTSTTPKTPVASVSPSLLPVQGGAVLGLQGRLY